ncbi:MAG: hypothetical protein IOMNBAOH_01096 [Rhodocyclaceae bacterium]|nr:hypothetical protein [Rhodocyclaceae bacterium]
MEVWIIRRVTAPTAAIPGWYTARPHFRTGVTVLIAPAYAQTASGTAQDPTGGLMGMLPLIIMAVVLWFLMIRPQMKRTKEHRAMLGGLQKGDEVVTQGGIAGRISRMGENYLHVEIADGVEIAVQKQAIATLLPKGTLKNL